MNSNSDLNNLIILYKETLAVNEIQKAYMFLMKYIRKLKTEMSKKYQGYNFGYVSQGYMDYTYFPIDDVYLRKYGLRFGIVLNHSKIQFELWLMGRNAQIQKEYWAKLKTSKWNYKIDKMPIYSVLEIVLVDNPNFNDLTSLTNQISESAFNNINEIREYLKEK